MTEEEIKDILYNMIDERLDLVFYEHSFKIECMSSDIFDEDDFDNINKDWYFEALTKVIEHRAQLYRAKVNEKIRIKQEQLDKRKKMLGL